MPKSAFLTLANKEGWVMDDDLVHEPLRQFGWEVENVPWDADVDWNAFDVVIIRSPWDYQQQIDKFLFVLQQIEGSSARLFNSLEIVRWNIDKKYLFEMQSAGIEIVPTLLVDSLTVGKLLKVFQHFQCDEIIIKPTIGANADDTFRINRQTDETTLTSICELFASRESLAQPFLKSIVTEGEFSLIYLDGKLSHSILKTAQQGDFRVQEEHGGGVVPITNPEPELITAAEKTINFLPETPLYARVDMVRTNNHTFALMELELIEPCLYFRFCEKAATDFANVINTGYKGS